MLLKRENWYILWQKGKKVLQIRKSATEVAGKEERRGGINFFVAILADPLKQNKQAMPLFLTTPQKENPFLDNLKNINQFKRMKPVGKNETSLKEKTNQI